MINRLKEKKMCLRPTCESTDFIIRNIHGETYICQKCGCIIRESAFSYHVPNPDKNKPELSWKT